jgi:hypothetical protein
MLNTPVAQLRKEAPGSLTLAKVAAFFKSRRYPRTIYAIGDFERGKYLSPPDRFIQIYAQCIGQPVSKVRSAYRITHRLRAARAGPFAP